MTTFRDRVEIEDCYGVRQSGKAVLVHLPDGREEWFPVSQIDDESEVWNDDTDGTLIISRWIAQEKGLEP